MSTKGTTKRASKQDEINELKAKLAVLENNQSEGDKSESKIPLDDLISVMSLLSYPLNLSTKEKGQLKIK